MNDTSNSTRSPTMTTDRVASNQDRTHTKENDTQRTPTSDEVGGRQSSSTPDSGGGRVVEDTSDGDSKIKNVQDKKVFEYSSEITIPRS